MELIGDLFGIDPVNILALLAAGATLLVMAAIYMSALQRDPLKSRLKGIEERREALKAGRIRSNQRRSPIKPTDSVDLMRKVAQKLKLLQHEQTEKVRLQLAQAGFRSKDAIVIYQVARLALPFVMGIVGVIMFYGLGMMASYADFHAFMAGGLVLLGFKAPDIFLSNTKEKRVDAIRKSLPDAMDLMVVCAEAGLTLDSAMSRVAKEMGRASPEMADEFELTAIELGFLPERRQALLNLADRVELDTLRGLITALIQSERYGTPLASSLRELSAEFRNERMLKAEEKAARLPAILTVPLIMFILPVLFVVLLGPAACNLTNGLSAT